MITKNKIKGIAILGIITLVIIGSLSSFTMFNKGKEKAKKIAVNKSKKSAITTVNSRIYYIMYWNGTSWQSEFYAPCEGDGTICSGGFSPFGSTRDIPSLLNEAVLKYTFLGYLSNPSVSGASVTVGKNYQGDPETVSVQITERAY